MFRPSRSQRRSCDARPSKSTASVRSKPLSLERLESRRVLAAYINELHLSPLFGDQAQHQYVELRGTPNQSLPDGTYFIGVESADGVDELGSIHTIIDLSQQTFGSNGMLVLLQSGAGYAVNPDATTLRGTNGFLGLPGYSADNNSPSIHAGSSTYLLIHSNVAPQLNDDIDTNDDGIPESIFNSWEIQDSVAQLSWVEQVFSQHSYAQITFVEQQLSVAPPSVVMPGTTYLITEQQAYVGRIGGSTGYTAADWVSANTQEMTIGGNQTTWQFQLQHGVFGTPRPTPYGGRILDHIGSPNWYGTISGTVFQDDNSNGVMDQADYPLSGIPVDLGIATGSQSSLATETIFADSYAVDTTLTNISPNVTLYSADSNNLPHSFKIRSQQRFGLPAGNHVFSHEGVGFFNNDRRLMMDFYRPAYSVTASFIGNSNTTATYGRLEIFDSDGNSLGFVRTRPLGSGQAQTLTLTTGQPNIAKAVAYPEDTYLNSSPFGQINFLSFESSRVRGRTDTLTDGSYSFPEVPIGNFQVSVQVPQTYEQVAPANGTGRFVSILPDYSSVPQVDFSLHRKVAPSLPRQEFTLSEATQAGDIRTLPIQLGYSTQTLQFDLISGNTDELFSINPLTHALVLNNSLLDYETQVDYLLQLRMTDTVNAELTSMATIAIHVTDANDAPVVAAQQVELLEHSENGSLVASMSGTDQDPGAAGQLRWSIAAGNSDGAFAIDPISGAVTVQSASQVDFESAPRRTLTVRATDMGTPAMFGDGILLITLLDRNEPISIPEQSFEILEHAAADKTLGKLDYLDQDQGQTATWQVTGGSGQGIFFIDPASGTLRLGAQPLDYESIQEYTLDVVVSDSGTPPTAASQTLVIHVLDENDMPIIESAEFSIAENATGLVGIVLAHDPDADQRLTFALSGGDQLSLFEIDSNSGALSVRSDATLDFESQPTLEVEIMVTDSGAPTGISTSLFQIAVTDVNEAPVLNDGSLSIEENSSSGTNLSRVPVTDLDADEELTFSIVEQSQPWFSIDASTGMLSIAAGATLDFETIPSATVTVKVVDRGGLSDTHEYLVSVIDGPDAPVLVTPIGTQTFSFSEPVSFQIPEDAFMDPDSGDRLSYLVIDGSGFALPAWLTFDPDTRILSGTPTPSEIGTFTLQVVALDSHRLSARDTFDLVITEPLAPWQNQRLALDTTNDGIVTPIDVLLVINYLNSGAKTSVDPHETPSAGYLDTNGDNIISSIDVLLIINYLNQSGSGEGEFYLSDDSESLFDASMMLDQDLLGLFAFEQSSRKRT